MLKAELILDFNLSSGDFREKACCVELEVNHPYSKLFITFETLRYFQRGD